ncbi:Tat pathway signal sequence domain protein [Aquisalimonas lutea]|uniref:Tat pathway signal sequence domain protein n=1 Tax=Aquisalimonas lutea TaxID=1327750 RepID=UPI0025B44EFC|nr:Tat pathway signal sequence domain protein [Aquisalimonas lutea]MDN3516669.1 Tat pathway signal sequence domain protein [Aquisalimonas lutea]
MRNARLLLVLLIALLTGLPAVVAAEDGAISVELNKLESQGDACRAYLVMENGTGEAFESLRLDLVMFDDNGIIAKRLAVETAPLAAGRTQVKVFGIGDVACGDIGRVLLNGVLACADAGGERDDCMGRLTTASKTDVPFIQ